ncbi:140_t:CDS:2, partial [Cetraspora pellucida]
MYRTASGKISPNQEEILPNNFTSNLEEYKQKIINIITTNDPPSYQDALVEIQKHPQDTTIDTNYLSECITQDYQELFSKIKILEKTI